MIVKKSGNHRNLDKLTRTYDTWGHVVVREP